MDNSEGMEIFHAGDNSTVDADLYKGGIFLGCEFGVAAMYIWAVGILAAGQSSTMTGTYAGQFAMEGFLNLQWKRWQRVLLTRTVAIFPTFLVAFYSNISDLSGMNDLLNCLMSLQLPFALIPTITFTSSTKIMGQFTNGIGSKVFSITLSMLIVAVNTYFVVNYVSSLHIVNPGLISLISLVGIAYLLFCSYLTLDMILQMGCGDGISQIPILGRIFTPLAFHHSLQTDDTDDGNVE